MVYVYHSSERTSTVPLRTGTAVHLLPGILFSSMGDAFCCLFCDDGLNFRENEPIHVTTSS